MLPRKTLYTAMLLAGLGGAMAAAYSMPGRGGADASSAFCPALAQEAVYKKNNLWQYRIVIPGNDGWIFRTDNDFKMAQPMTPKTINSLRNVQKAFKDRGIDLITVYPPMRGLVHGDHLSAEDKAKYLANRDALWAQYERDISNLQKAGVHIVGMNRNETGADFYYRQNHHWSAEGARRMAKKVANYVRRLPSYGGIAKTQYVTADKGTAPYESSFEKVFNQICKTDIAPDNVRVFETTAATVASGSDALFGEVAPEIVLLGTSNSVNESSMANFEGFLKQDLSADIYNMAFIGAGIDSSIISFLNSPYYQQGRAKVAIWEIPAYYDLNDMDDKLFRQVIPAVYGNCATPVLTKRMNLDEGWKALFRAEPDTPDGQNLSALSPDGKYYIRLSFSEPVREELGLKFYSAGGEYKQEFNRSDRYPYDNAFYTLFPEGQGALQKISIEVPPGISEITVDAQVCEMPTGGATAVSPNKSL